MPQKCYVTVFLLNTQNSLKFTYWIIESHSEGDRYILHLNLVLVFSEWSSKSVCTSDLYVSVHAKLVCCWLIVPVV